MLLKSQLKTHRNRLLGSGSHLSSFTTKSSHSLLSPLGSHLVITEVVVVEELGSELVGMKFDERTGLRFEDSKTRIAKEESWTKGREKRQDVSNVDAFPFKIDCVDVEGFAMNSHLVKSKKKM